MPNIDVSCKTPRNPGTTKEIAHGQRSARIQASAILRDVAVAVLIDLVTSPSFDTAEPDGHADSEPHTLWQRDQDSIALVLGRPNLPLPIDALDEADFVKPIGWFEPS